MARSWDASWYGAAGYYVEHNGRYIYYKMMYKNKTNAHCRCRGGRRDGRRHRRHRHRRHCVAPRPPHAPSGVGAAALRRLARRLLPRVVHHEEVVDADA